MALLYLPFPAPASAFTGYQRRGLGQAPHAQGRLQNWLNTKRTTEGETLHYLQCLPAQLGQATHHSDAQELQKKCIPQNPSCPTFLHSHLHKENREPLRQPSQTGFSLLASSSSLESSIVAPLTSIPRAATAPQHKYEHLLQYSRKSIQKQRCSQGLVTWFGCSRSKEVWLSGGFAGTWAQMWASARTGWAACCCSSPTLCEPNISSEGPQGQKHQIQPSKQDHKDVLGSCKRPATGQLPVLGCSERCNQKYYRYSITTC